MHVVQEYLKRNSAVTYEGHIYDVPEQVDLILKIISDCNLKKILQIGFNVGHSAELFLSETKASVISFELNSNLFISDLCVLLNKGYKKRHKIVYGNSKLTIPKYIADNPKLKFDLIFIDGGHDLRTAYSDIKNCFKLAHEKTIVVMDDVVRKNVDASWVAGPTMAWQRAIEDRLIAETGYMCFEGHLGRGMSWGKYNLGA
jgi:predicted O-methyltransferase YrrM